MKLNEKIHISLTIDSDNNTSFDIDPNEDLDVLCPKIVKKYNLSQKVQKNMKKYIKNFIAEEIEKEKEKKKVLKQKEEASVYRLYTQSIQNEKKKKDCLKKLKEDKMNDLVNKFPFKPKILFNKRYERNYDKIEDKLINDGKKSKEKNALRKIAKEIENRNIMRTDLKMKNAIGYASVDSILYNEEKKILSTNESINPTHQKKSSIIYNNTSSNQLQNFSNIQFSQINNNYHHNLASINTLHHHNNSNYQILITDENNKSIIKGLENSLTKQNNYMKGNFLFGVNNPNNNNQPQLIRVENHLNTSINKNSTKAISNNGKNLDNSLCKKDSHQTQNNKNNVQNTSINANNHLSNNLQSGTHNNMKYSEHYLKQKNNCNENVYNTSMQQSSISQKKNESSLNISNQINNNHQEVKTIKEIMLGNRNTTTNQNIESYNSARMITKTISFGKENTISKDSKEKNKTNFKNNEFNKRIIQYKKNKNDKKNNDSMIVYKFKSDKYNNKKYSTIYESSKELKRAKEEHYQHIISSEYSFRPILTEASREYISKSLNKHESREEFLNRLTNSKRMKNLSMNLMKKDMSLENKGSQKKAIINGKRSFSNKSFNTNKFITTEETDLKSYNNAHIVVTNERDDTSKIREVKQNKELIDNIKHQQFKEKKLLNNCTEKILNNINAFKLNNLKEVFEIIYNNCSNIDDIENIENYGISSKIKDKLILPTCHIMKERNLEFNFQNFFMISNEIINFTIDV